MTTEKTIALTRWTFVDKIMSLLFNMLSRLVTTFLPRSKRLLISWLQSPSAVTLEPPPQKKKSQPREVSMGHFRGEHSNRREPQVQRWEHIWYIPEPVNLDKIIEKI